MAKKKKLDRNDALNELKTLESKWLKDSRMDELTPIQMKVMAAKVAALLDYVEANELDVSFDNWPPQGAEDLVKMDRSVFQSGPSSPRACCRSASSTCPAAFLRTALRGEPRASTVSRSRSLVRTSTSHSRAEPQAVRPSLRKGFRSACRQTSPDSMPARSAQALASRTWSPIRTPILGPVPVVENTP